MHSKQSKLFPEKLLFLFPVVLPDLHLQGFPVKLLETHSQRTIKHIQMTSKMYPQISLWRITENYFGGLT